jgi:phenylpropionate dioxygenase-like ring-hydroxylating dioxygenase large terminal subunit
MSALTKLKIFNNPKVVTEGWYWALPSRELKAGKIKHLRMFGKDLAIFRGENGETSILDAHCPHMGAHLAEGKVEGNSVRCFFHHWKFDNTGNLEDIPCRQKLNVRVKTGSYPTKEQYGMIWLWIGEGGPGHLPYVPELKDQEVDFLHGTPFIKECHTNVMMINAIDAHHFYSVHHLPVKLHLEPKVIDDRTIQFNNTTKMPTGNFLTRFFGRFYAGALTYSMCYFNASTGTVTIGPDFLHFHIMFAIRQNDEGKACGQTILVTKKRKGIIGKVVNRVLLELTRVVGNYFAKGDTEVFKTIKFNFKTPLVEDHAIIKFIQHAERMTVANWGFSKREDNFDKVLDVTYPYIEENSSEEKVWQN